MTSQWDILLHSVRVVGEQGHINEVNISESVTDIRIGAKVANPGIPGSDKRYLLHSKLCLDPDQVYLAPIKDIYFTANCVWIVGEQSCCSHLFPGSISGSIWQTAAARNHPNSSKTSSVVRVLSFIRQRERERVYLEGWDCDSFLGQLQFVSAASSPPPIPQIAHICQPKILLPANWPNQQYFCPSLKDRRYAN